jgi:hypothetical protein
MFDGLKKLSLRTSADNILGALTQLVRCAEPYEVLAIAQVQECKRSGLSDAAIVESIALVIAKATQDPMMRKLVNKFQFELMGPIPLASVRNDLIQPALATLCPVHWSGVIVTKAVSEALRNAQLVRGKEVQGIESLWADAKRASVCAQLHITTPDTRFATL